MNKNVEKRIDYFREELGNMNNNIRRVLHGPHKPLITEENLQPIDLKQLRMGYMVVGFDINFDDIKPSNILQIIKKSDNITVTDADMEEYNYYVNNQEHKGLDIVKETQSVNNLLNNNHKIVKVKKSDSVVAPTVADPNTKIISGGRRSRNQRKSRKSKKQRNQRKSRRSRR